MVWLFTESSQRPVFYFRRSVVSLSLLLFFYSHLLAMDDSPDYFRYRGAIFGMPAAVPSMLRNFSGPLLDALKLSESMIEKGGLNPQQAYDVLHLPSETADRLNYAHHAARKLNSGLNHKSSRLARLIPVTLGYLQQKENREMAVICAVDLEGDSCDELRDTASVYSHILALVLQFPQTGRQEILRQSSGIAANSRVKDALVLARTDSMLPNNSMEPADILASVLQAWYHSRSFMDAIHRLGRTSENTRLLLCGALAGAAYGPREIPADRQIQGELSLILEQRLAGLFDLARDNVLLSVKHARPLLQVKMAEAGKRTTGNLSGEGHSVHDAYRKTDNSSLHILPDPTRPLRSSSADSVSAGDVPPVRAGYHSGKFGTADSSPRSSQIPLISRVSKGEPPVTPARF